MVYRWSVYLRKAVHGSLRCDSNDAHRVILGGRPYCTSSETRTRVQHLGLGSDELMDTDPPLVKSTDSGSIAVPHSVLLAMVHSGQWDEALRKVKDCTAEGDGRSKLLTTLLSSLVSSPNHTQADAEGHCSSLAFAVWSTATSTLGYTAPPSLLHRLAAHSLFIDGNAQEALDMLMIANALTSDSVAGGVGSQESQPASLDEVVMDASEMWLSYMAHRLSGRGEDAWYHLHRLTSLHVKVGKMQEATFTSTPSLIERDEVNRSAVLLITSLVLHAWVLEASSASLTESPSSFSLKEKERGAAQKEDSNQPNNGMRTSLFAALVEKYFPLLNAPASDRDAVSHFFHAVETVVECVRASSEGVGQSMILAHIDRFPSLFADFSLVPCHLAYLQECVSTDESSPDRTSRNVELRRAAYTLYNSYSSTMNTHSPDRSCGMHNVPHPYVSSLFYGAANEIESETRGSTVVSMGHLMLSRVPSGCGDSGDCRKDCMQSFTAGLARLIVGGTQQQQRSVDASHDRGPIISSSSGKTLGTLSNQLSTFASVLLIPLDVEDDSASIPTREIGKSFMRNLFSQNLLNGEKFTDGALLRCFGMVLPYLESVTAASRDGESGTGRRRQSVLLGESHDFLVGVLEALCETKSSAGKDGCAQWHRVVSKLVKLLLRPRDAPSIPVNLQRSLHRLWWLPELIERGSASVEDEQTLIAQLVDGASDSGVLERDGSAACERMQHLRSILLLWKQNPSYDFLPDERKRRIDWCGGTRTEGQLDKSAPVMAHNILACEWLVGKMPSTASERLNLLDAVRETLSRCSNYHRSDLAQNIIPCLLSPFTNAELGSTTEKKRPISLLESVSHSTLLLDERLRADLPQDYFSKHHIPFLIAVLHWIPVLPSLSELHAIFTPHTLRAHKSAWDSASASDAEELAFPSFISRTIIIYAARAADTSNSSSDQRTGIELSRSAARQAAALLVEAGALWTESPIVDPFTVRAVSRALRHNGDVEGLQGFLSVVFYRLCPLDTQEGGFRAKAIQRALSSRFGQQVKSTSRSRGEALACIVDIAMEYLMACWEAGCYETVLKVLFVKNPRTPDVARADAEIVSRAQQEGVKRAAEGKWSSVSLICEDIGYLLPKVAREALRLLVILHANTTDLQGNRRDNLISAITALRLEGGEGGNPESDVLLIRTPSRQMNPEAVENWLMQFERREPRFCKPSPVLQAAREVLLGHVALRNACKQLLNPSASGDWRRRIHETVSPHLHHHAQKKYRKSDINVLIDGGHWAEALRVIPTVLTDPKHVLRKCLIACEAVNSTDPGSSWVGALQIFQHFLLHNHPTVMGAKEIGRVACIIANANQWEAALHVFRAAGPQFVDDFLFAQVAFALTASNQHDLLIDLWAEWRSMAGDRADTTPEMVRRFVIAGCRGSGSTAFAACDLLVRASRQKLDRTGGREGRVPGTALHVDVPSTERAIVTLLRTRWEHSWQQAVQIAAAMKSSQVRDTVARKTPQNPFALEILAQMHQQQKLPQGQTDAATRHALVYQVDVTKLHDTDVRKENESDTHTQKPSYDSVARVLDLLLDDS